VTNPTWQGDVQRVPPGTSGPEAVAEEEDPKRTLLVAANTANQRAEALLVPQVKRPRPPQGARCVKPSGVTTTFSQRAAKADQKKNTA
jgi:hypothetical protein